MRNEHFERLVPAVWIAAVPMAGRAATPPVSFNVPFANSLSSPYTPGSSLDGFSRRWGILTETASWTS